MRTDDIFRSLSNSLEDGTWGEEWRGEYETAISLAMLGERDEIAPALPILMKNLKLGWLDGFANLQRDAVDALGRYESTADAIALLEEIATRHDYEPVRVHAHKVLDALRKKQGR